MTFALCVVTESQSEVLWRCFCLGISHLPLILRNWFIGSPGTKRHDSVNWLYNACDPACHLKQLNGINQECGKFIWSWSWQYKCVEKAGAKDPLGFLLIWLAQSVFSYPHLWLKLESLYMYVCLHVCWCSTDWVFYRPIPIK